MVEEVTYASAGVDTEAGDRAVELMKAAVEKTHGPTVLGGFGGFSGLVDASALLGMQRPLLSTSTDGVGTKVAVAQAMDIHDTIGYDLVGMVVDDIVVCGARPLFMTDYIACGKVVPERIADIVRGIAEACQVAGTALVGGETAEHPGLLGEHEYDVAGAATGVVDADKVLSAELVKRGDVILAMASSGLHSNGYSLVRRVLASAGWAYDREVAELGRTIGEEILTPTRVYAADCLALLDDASIAPGVRVFSHVTGGGLAANLARVLPQGLLATVDRATWARPLIFDLVGDLGRVPQRDLEGTLNLGVGMIAVLDPAVVDAAAALLAARGIENWVLGSVSAGAAADAADAGLDYTVQGAKGVDGGSVRMVGTHRSR
ncbi:phosphoribosylformylglycinamidine cyclo-ligase [Micrococcales bacterium 31B]|nr:phosphoribosylformylglycinamidine cyclo-ligase [Micrococcales bacterium 31B]